MARTASVRGSVPSAFMQSPAPTVYTYKDVGYAENTGRNFLSVHPGHKSVPLLRFSATAPCVALPSASMQSPARTVYTHKDVGYAENAGRNFLSVHPGRKSAGGRQKGQGTHVDIASQSA